MLISEQKHYIQLRIDGYSLRELNVDGIKRNNEIFIIVDLLEGINDTRFASNAPNKVLMRETIVQTHTLLIENGQVVLLYTRRIVSVESELAGLHVSLFDSLVLSSKTHNPSSQEYIASAYSSAFPFGIAPFTMANPSRVKASRKSPKCLSVPSTRILPKPCRLETCSAVWVVVSVVDILYRIKIASGICCLSEMVLVNEVLKHLNMLSRPLQDGKPGQVSPPHHFNEDT